MKNFDTAMYLLQLIKAKSEFDKVNIDDRNQYSWSKEIKDFFQWIREKSGNCF